MSNLNSTSKLTEFPALEAEEKAEGKFSLSKFMFWRQRDDAPIVVAVGDGALQQASGGALAALPQILSTVEDGGAVGGGRKISVTMPPQGYNLAESNLSNPSPEPSLDGYEARSLPNVLHRISSLIAMGSNNQADLKKYWMPDSVSKECYDCAEKFTTFRRRHHCRICGQIFCSRCCSQEIPGKVIGYTGDLRVCVYCCKIVLSYLRSSDSNSDLTDDLKTVQEDLQNRLGGSGTPDLTNYNTGGMGPFSNSVSDHSGIYRSLPRRKASVGYQEERFVASKERFSSTSTDSGADKPKIVWDWVSLKAMWEEMLNPVTGIDWATHRHNMMKYCHSCVVGSELVDWLLAQRKISWRGQGVQIGQLLIDANLLECVSQAEQVFVDAYALYKPVQVPLSIVQETPESSGSARSSADFGDVRTGVGIGGDWGGGQDPLWVTQIKNPQNNKIEEELEPKLEDHKAAQNVPSATDNTSQEDLLNSKSRLPSSASLYSLDLNLSESTVTLTKPKDTLDPYSSESGSRGSSPLPSQLKTTPKGGRKLPHSTATTEAMTDEFLQKTLKSKPMQLVAPTGWHSSHQLTSDSEVRAFQMLCNSYVRHENNLLGQLLDSMNLSSSWTDVILPIVRNVTEIVRPDVRHADDEMDIRQYIRFKKLPGGSKADCRIVNGVVCTKNVAHRHMRNRLKDPKILLIGSSIDYQRFENRFLSLEPLVMQEYDYLKNIVARIAAMKPDLVIVEKTVSRLAQELMLDHGITLVINVKASVMERIGRLTQGVIWESADMQLQRPQLGLCHNFCLETFHLTGNLSKTLMFFDGCAMHLGCTVLLRGGPSSELVKVKKIISHLVFVAYNWRLERSFHVDSFAMPPEENPDDKKEKAVSVSSPGSGEFEDAIEDVVSNNEAAATNKSFDSCIDDIILSASPFITYPIPYLETEAGKNCELRKFFPQTIYWSVRSHRSNSFGAMSINQQDSENNNMDAVYRSVYINSKLVADKPDIQWEPPHQFTTARLTEAVLSDDVQGLVADFRRTGTRLRFSTVGDTSLLSEEKLKSNTSSWNTLDNEKLKPEDHDGQIDALDPFKHQRLAVMFCSYSPISANAPYFCVNPWVVNMDMYGRNDISLGMFLERYCFRKTYLCPARQCDTPMLDHIRKFVHYDGCVEVILRELKSPILGSGESILMWSWCALCKTVSPIVPMSVDAWSLSFAKYLELRFYGTQYGRRGYDNPCSHSLHQHHQHYFAQHSVVAAFKFSPVHLWEVTLPQSQISVQKVPKTVAQLIEDVKNVAIMGHGVFTNISEVLLSLKENSTGLRVEEVLSALTEQQKAERSVFRSRIEDIQVNLASPTLRDTSNPREAEAFLWKVTDSIGFLKCSIAEIVNSWNSSLNNFILQRKKEEKLAKDGTSSSRPVLSRMESEPILPIVKELEDSGRLEILNISSDNTTSTLLDSQIKDNISIGSRNALEVNSTDDSLSAGKLATVITSSDPFPMKRSASPSPSLSSQRQEHERTKSEGAEKIVKNLHELPDEVVDFGRTEKRSSSSAVKTIISHFISGSGSVQVIQSPWSPIEHHLQASLCVIPIRIFENEPSSIVACALGSVEYRNKLKNSSKSMFQLSMGEEDNGVERKDRLLSVELGGSDELPTSVKHGNSSEFSKTNDDPEEDKSKKSNANIEVQFNSSSAKFYCRVYFAEQFRQLRKLCLIEGEEFYIRSLARCVSWAASGGKSGSTFCKTIDDRFVIKQMSRFEIQSFLDFAPNYFEYMKSAFQENKPTVLAKILGVYRIGFKNGLTSAANKTDILIMENLFYDRKISQKFDLKGSIRNRLANVAGKEQEDLVLLDENLVNMACENPIYIRPHTKTVLSLALSNDSRFLASQMVMDYSLLVGLDEKKSELVVGIIDYIRTFTWDKKIENFVKSTGILGGQGRAPTVVSPTEYQTRFCEALDRYFLLVPDRWLGLGLGIDS